MAWLGSSGRAAAVGALLAQLACVPFFPQWSPLPAAHAAWCWDAQPPKCKAPVVASGSCAEGTVLPAGTFCTPICSGGKVPMCPSGAVPQCPPSLTGTASCTGDIAADTWWYPCLGADPRVCATDLQLGTAGTARFGTFECVDAVNASGSCAQIAVADAEDSRDWDAATAGFVGGLALLTAVSAVLARLPLKGSAVALFWPGPGGWTPASLGGTSLVAAGLVVFTAVLAGGVVQQEGVFATGLAAGLAASLPIFWAFFKAGIHSVVGMSREAAWKVHTAFGNLSLIFGTTHAVVAFVNVDDVLSNAFYALGFAGLILMWAGVLPTVIQVISPSAIGYDHWKGAHYTSAIGYILALIHMWDHAATFQTPRSLIVSILNSVAILAYAAQKIYTKLFARRITIESAEVIADKEDKHVILSLFVPGFKYAPGQWGHIWAPTMSLVPHPFTIVPGATEGDQEHVRFFMKVVGDFTQKLALASAKPSSMPWMVMQGPYGRPALPSPGADAVVFVLGGVGVTPALALVPQARATYGVGGKVRMYWSMRSPVLLRHCAPLLEPHLDLGLQCVRLKLGAVGNAEAGRLPLRAQLGRGNVEEWLAKVASDLSALGASTAVLFICGDPGLAAAAKKAAWRQKGLGVAWRVHLEQFHFLPQLPKLSVRGGPVQVQPTQVGASSEG